MSVLSPWGQPRKIACPDCKGRGQRGVWVFRRACSWCRGRGWHFGYNGREWRETDR